MTDDRLRDELERRAGSVRLDPDWSRRQLLSSVRHAIDTRPAPVASSRWSPMLGLASAAAILLLLVFVAPRLAQGPAASDARTDSATSPERPSPAAQPAVAMSTKEFATALATGQVRGSTVVVNGSIETEARRGPLCLMATDPCWIGTLGGTQPPIDLVANGLKVPEGTGSEIRGGAIEWPWWSLPDHPASGDLVLKVDDDGAVEYLGFTESAERPVSAADAATVDLSPLGLGNVLLVRGWLVDTEPDGQNIQIDCANDPAEPIPGLPNRWCQPVDFLSDVKPDGRGLLGDSANRLPVQRDAATRFATDDGSPALYAVAPRLYGGGCEGEPPCWLWEVVAHITDPSDMGPAPSAPPATPTPAPLGIIDCTSEIDVTLTDYIGEVESCQLDRLTPEPLSGDAEVVNPSGDPTRLDVSWISSGCIDRVDVAFRATTDRPAGDRYQVHASQSSLARCEGPATMHRLHLTLSGEVSASVVEASVSTSTPSPPAPSITPARTWIECSDPEGEFGAAIVDDYGLVRACRHLRRAPMDVSSQLRNPGGDLTLLQFTWFTNPCGAAVGFTLIPDPQGLEIRMGARPDGRSLGGRDGEVIACSDVGVVHGIELDLTSGVDAAKVTLTEIGRSNGAFAAELTRSGLFDLRD
jgi:hypothetical protein